MAETWDNQARGLGGDLSPTVPAGGAERCLRLALL